MPRLDGARLLTISPSNDSVPPLMVSSPATSRSNVDLPQPEGPTNTMNSPDLMVRSTPRMTSTVPNDLRTFLSCSSAIETYPLTPPAVRPEMILRWKINTSTTSGAVTSTEAAMIVPHGISCSELPENSEIATGTVRAELLEVKVSANRYSFPAAMNASSPV